MLSSRHTFSCREESTEPGEVFWYFTSANDQNLYPDAEDATRPTLFSPLLTEADRLSAAELEDICSPLGDLDEIFDIWEFLRGTLGKSDGRSFTDRASNWNECDITEMLEEAHEEYRYIESAYAKQRLLMELESYRRDLNHNLIFSSFLSGIGNPRPDAGPEVLGENLIAMRKAWHTDSENSDAAKEILAAPLQGLTQDWRRIHRQLEELLVSFPEACGLQLSGAVPGRKRPHP